MQMKIQISAADGGFHGRQKFFQIKLGEIQKIGTNKYKVMQFIREWDFHVDVQYFAQILEMDYLKL